MNEDSSTTIGTLQQKLQRLLPDGIEVYNTIMSGIDEDLLTTNIPLLEEKYIGETEEERSTRIQRYKSAIQQYDMASKEFFAQLDSEVDTHRDAVEKEAMEDDIASLTSLENDISSEAE